MNKKEIDYELISLDQSELITLIKKLEVIKIDKKFIMELSENIEDLTIKNAISDFITEE